MLRLIRGGEDTFLELKVKLSNSERIAQEIVALANTGGGIIVFGVNDQLRVEGIEDGENVQDELVRICREDIVPPLIPFIDRIAFDNGRRIVALDIDGNGVVEATNNPDASDYRLTYPGKGTLIHSAAWRLRPNYNGEYDHHIAAAAATHNVSTQLVRAVIQVESDFDSLARSSKGAQGLMQLMPDTARQLGVSNAFDPRQNIFAGVRYLRILLDMFQGDVSLATAAYNGGATNVQRYGGVPPFKETRNYVAKIQSLLSGLGVPMAASAASAQMVSYAPGENPFGLKAPAVAATAGAVKRTGKLTPARPKTYYRWKDASGVTHVAQEPPAEGVVYSTIRALD